ncbi:hypothetical protein LCD36_08805 [Saccharopolyspora sp. 6T]|uniref:hypothetical protein n=1 Tax=Saccharopolyspora sp. 6T TaxID=2877238 RepID=UPI001CD2E1AB|nr:hypothetical protein [Saccharopolyspora sp. 6T]MCA1186540.1 hypothetical protein [Saccharopolyspora sp. 6T]
MSRDSGSEHPSQRTVAELLAEYGGGSQRSAHRRRRRAEDPSETAPQAIIQRVLSDSGTMRAIKPEEAEEAGSGQPEGGAPQAPGRAAPQPQGTGPQPAVPPAGPPAPPAAPQQFSGPPPAGPPPGPPRPQAPAAQAPAPQAPAAQAPAPAPQAPPVEDEQTADPDQGSGFWARRFAAAGARPRATPPPDAPDAGPSDAEMTVQQPALGPVPAAGPHEQPTRSVPLEGATEQLPRVEAEAKSAGADGTAMLAYPPADAAPARGDDPYDFDDYEDYDSGTAYASPANYDDYAEDAEATRYREDGYDADDEFDEYDEALPAGLDADDYRADADDDEEESEPTTGKEWLVLALQGGAGLVCGGAVWFAFRWLWTAIPIAALVAALAITGALVFIARKFLRTDDLQTILLAVLVGLICTVSPAALLLIGQ